MCSWRMLCISIASIEKKKLRKMKSIKTKSFNAANFVLLFYTIYVAFWLAGYIVIDLKPISVYAVFCIAMFIFSLYVGCVIGRSFKPIKFSIYCYNPNSIVKKLLYISLPSLFIGWYFMIKYYGSVQFIFQYAMNIREETIGDGIQIIPTIVSYMTSFMFTGLVLSMALLHYHRCKKNLFFVVIYSVLIILFDLQSFGRIGMLFVIFTILSFVIFYKVKIPRFKAFISTSIFYIVFMLPRYLRGGGTIEGIDDEFAKYYKIAVPAFLSSFISVYCYYFVGFNAFSEYLNKGYIQLYYGERNFASLVNLLNRFFSVSDGHRISIIADFVKIPFETNIYTIVGECYMDFGFVGIMLLPLFFGTSIGFLFNYHGVFSDALKLVLIVWVLYTPLYNMFSFGAFFLAYLTLLYFTLFSYEKNINYYR